MTEGAGSATATTPQASSLAEYLAFEPSRHNAAANLALGLILLATLFEAAVKWTWDGGGGAAAATPGAPTPPANNPPAPPPSSNPGSGY